MAEPVKEIGGLDARKGKDGEADRQDGEQADAGHLHGYALAGEEIERAYREQHHGDRMSVDRLQAAFYGHFRHGASDQKATSMTSAKRSGKCTSIPRSKCAEISQYWRAARRLAATFYCMAVADPALVSRSST